MTERYNDPTHNSNSLFSLTYFKSPLLTLISSLDVSTADNLIVHDIIDAYATLSSRIRSISSLLTQGHSDFPALRAIANCSDALARCLQKDIRHALDDPFPTSFQAPPLQVLTQRETTDSSEEEIVHTARDASMLAQYAIQTTATLFRFRPFTALFSGEYVLSRRTRLC